MFSVREALLSVAGGKHTRESTAGNLRYVLETVSA